MELACKGGWRRGECVCGWVASVRLKLRLRFRVRVSVRFRMVSQQAKPFGVCVVSHNDVPAVLAATDITRMPGREVGRSSGREGQSNAELAVDCEG